MSPYRTVDTVNVKVFSTVSPEQLEAMLNSWLLEHSKCQIIDIIYRSHRSTDSDIYSALVSYAAKEFEPDMC